MSSRTQTSALVAIVALLLVTAEARSQGVIMVPADQPTITAAIAAALPGTTILVAPGIYSEQIDFLGLDLVLAATGGPDVTFIEPATPFPYPPQPNVIFQGGETRAAVLEGFTIRFANAGAAGPRIGGGIHIQGASPTIRDCHVLANAGSDGGSGPGDRSGGAGGIQINQGAPLIEGCRFEDNIGGQGGYGPVATSVTDTWFGGAGAIGIDRSAPGIVEVRRCRLEMNFGGNSVLPASGITVGPSPTLRAGGTGGLAMRGTTQLALSDTLVARNSGGHAGTLFSTIGGPRGTGGLLLLDVVEARRLTVAENHAGTFPLTPIGGEVGGIAWLLAGTAPLESSIVWNNVGSFGGPANFGLIVPPIHSSIIQGGAPSGTNNLAADPQFLAPATGDFHLQPSSPAIDSGLSTGTSPFERDADGRPRITGAGIDRGALELDKNAGTGLDFRMGSAVNGGGDPGFPIKAALPGDIVGVTFFSPGGTFDFGVPALLGQVFPTGMPPLSPSNLPDLNVNLPGVVVVFDGNAFGPAALPPGGMSFSFVLPGALSGFTARLQALVFDGSAPNGFFVTSDAVDFIVP
ncbi:MAG: choice-of-anchor Q domain-containing protein [Planctomycetota bacterium]